MCRRIVNSEFSNEQLQINNCTNKLGQVNWRLLQEESSNSALQKRRRRLRRGSRNVAIERKQTSGSSPIDRLAVTSAASGNNSCPIKRCASILECDLPTSRQIYASQFGSRTTCYSCCYSSHSYCCCSSNDNDNNALSIKRVPGKIAPSLAEFKQSEANRLFDDECESHHKTINRWRRRNNNNSRGRYFKRSNLALVANVLIMFPIYIFLLETILPCDSSSLTASHVEDSMKSDKISRQPRANAEVRQSFRRVPELTVKTTRGQSILLACEVDNQEGPAQWLKDNSYIFHSNRTRAKTTEFDHIKIAGNGTDGDHSLVIENASEKDTGHYECQVMGKDDNGHEIWAASDVDVLPPPPIAIITELSSSSSSPSALSSDQSLSSSSINTTNELNMLTRQAPNEQHQARVVVKATHLPSSAFISPSHASSNAHPTVASTTIGPTGAHLVISWPYVLLLFAALLMMANIYLIYSLVKRHQRKKDNSLESASSGSAGTGSSRIETTEQPNSSPLEFYTSSPSVLITSGSSSVGACNYNNVVPVPPPHPPTPSCGGANVSGPNGPTFQPANVGYAAPILHGTAYHLPGSWVLEC